MKFRRIYPYTCSRCGKERKSYLWQRVKGTVCTKCQEEKVADGQASLFDLTLEPIELKDLSVSVEI